MSKFDNLNWNVEAPWLLRWISIGLVSTVDECISILEKLGTAEVQLLRSKHTKLRDWEDYYSSRRQIIFDFIKYLSNGLGIDGYIPFIKSKKGLERKLTSSLEQFFSLTDSEQKKLFDTYSFLHSRADEFFGNEFLGLGIDPVLVQVDKSIDEYMKREDAWFFMQVFFPCVILHGRLPSQLLASATDPRGPNFDDLKSLFILDPAVRRHHRVQYLLDDAKPEWINSATESLRIALAKPQGDRICRIDLKCSTAAWIVHFSELFGSKLNVVQIRDLFDAFAKRGGELRDHDLPESDEAFKRRYNRCRERIAIFKWDKNKIPIVPTNKGAA